MGSLVAGAGALGWFYFERGKSSFCFNLYAFRARYTWLDQEYLRLQAPMTRKWSPFEMV